MEGCVPISSSLEGAGRVSRQAYAAAGGMVLDDEMALNGEVVWDGGMVWVTRLQVQLQRSRITRVKVGY